MGELPHNFISWTIKLILTWNNNNNTFMNFCIYIYHYSKTSTFVSIQLSNSWVCVTFLELQKAHLYNIVFIFSIELYIIVSITLKVLQYIKNTAFIPQYRINNDLSKSIQDIFRFQIDMINLVLLVSMPLAMGNNPTESSLMSLQGGKVPGSKSWCVHNYNVSIPLCCHVWRLGPWYMLVSCNTILLTQRKEAF